MSTTNIVRVCVLAIALSVSGCGRLSGSKGLGFPTRHRGDALPTIRLVPEWPPHGEKPYPRGTKIDKHAGVIYFPPESGETLVWIDLEISGWGHKRITGFESHISRGPICPSPPCWCEVAPFVASCSADAECPRGSGCATSKCNPAFINEKRRDYVFRGKNTMQEVQDTPNGYRFVARLDHSEPGIRDDGRRKYAGTILRVSYDYCPVLTQRIIEFAPALDSQILFEDGSQVNPIRGDAMVIVRALAQ